MTYSICIHTLNLLRWLLTTRATTRRAAPRARTRHATRRATRLCGASRRVPSGFTPQFDSVCLAQRTMSCESNCHLQPWSNATEEEGMAVASAVFVLFCGYRLLNKINKKKKRRRWWMSTFNKSRSR